MRLVKLRFIIPTVIVIAGLVIAGLELTNTTHFFHSNQATSGVIPSKPLSPKSNNKQPSITTSPNGSSTNNNTSSTIPSSTNNNSNQNSKTPSGGSGPISPFGNFVSNHSPSLSGNLSNEVSVCNTTPGATCTITFTEGSVVKSLSTETADDNGSCYWSWNVGSAGFTTGSWQIKATATFNGLSESVIDPRAFVVSS